VPASSSITGVRVREVKSEEVDLALHAAADADGFAKVDLGMSRRMLYHACSWP
jgi:hypothetical protein